MKSFVLFLIVSITMCNTCFCQKKNQKNKIKNETSQQKVEKVKINNVDQMRSDSSKVAKIKEEAKLLNDQRTLDAITQSILKAVISKINTDPFDRSGKNIYKNVIVNEQYPIIVNLLNEKPKNGNAYDILVGDELNYKSNDINISGRIHIIRPNYMSWVLIGDGHLDINMNSADINYRNSSAAVKNAEVDVYPDLIQINGQYLFGDSFLRGHKIKFIANESPGFFMDGDTLIFDFHDKYIISNGKLGKGNEAKVEKLVSNKIINYIKNEPIPEDSPSRIIYYTKAINKDSNDVEAYYYRGIEESKLGNHTNAIKDFTKVLEFNSENPDVNLARGKSKYEIGDKKGACEDWKIASDNGIKEALDLLKEHCK